MTKIALAILGLLAALPSYAKWKPEYAQVPPEIQQWFNGLKSQSGIPCCDTADGHRLTDADWDTKDNHYRVRIDGKWIVVPPEAVLTIPNRVGVPVVWYGGAGDYLHIYCFLPGGGA